MPAHLRLLLQIGVALLLVLGGCTTTQPRTDAATARAIVDRIQATDAAIEEFRLNLGPLKYRFQGEQLDALQQGLDARRGTLRDRLAAVYAAHLDPATLRALDRFLATPAGREYAARMRKLDHEVQRVTFAWGQAAIESALNDPPSE